MCVYLCVCVCSCVKKSQSHKASDNRGDCGEKRALGNWSQLYLYDLNFHSNNIFTYYLCNSKLTF